MTPKAKQALKAQAHRLKPIAMIGGKGLTAAVKNEIDIALDDHELIKVRVSMSDRDEKKLAIAEICESLSAEVVQVIGHICVLYRKRVES